jgi:Zn-dependent metalloprotease
MRIDSTVHYGTHFENALWNGRQMVYGDGDGRIFKRFTASVDVIAHELTHGVTQHAAALGYAGQTGALNEHLSDAFGIMVKQYTLGQSAHESDWLIGADILGPDVQGSAVRSLAFPGTAYDDPVLGRDPQPSHMRDYVVTTDDHGGVHINSGILNRGFYLAAMAMEGKTWEVLGRIWYAALTDRLTPEADFADFTRATVDIAGELYGNGSRVQMILVGAWSDVGLPVSVFDSAKGRLSIRRASPTARRSSTNHQPSKRRTFR